MTQETPAARPPLANHRLVYASVLELIGDTPLVEIPLERAEPRARVWGKLESFNPGGSTKDRICIAMLEAARNAGALKPGGLVVEPTSGNTGIGLALVCTRLGYRCVLTMPESMSLERRALLESMGAKVVLTKAEDQMAGAIEKAEQIAREEGGFIPRQFDNEANPRVHEQGTAREILHAMSGDPISVFVAGIGTGGTISGVARVLKREQPNCRIVGVEAESCATISRGEVGPTKIQGWAAGFVPANYDPSVVDEVVTVTDRQAFDTKRALAKAGLLLGLSSGGAVRVALNIAKTRSPDEHVVVVLPDTGERYFSLDEYFRD